MKNIFIISLVFLLSFVLSQKVLKAQQSIDTWLEDSIFKNASVGLLIVEQNTNEVIYQKNENTSLIPASCMKLFSTATACEVLGQNFKFKTEIAYSGKIAQNGSLHGNIYIIGYGDPALGAERFANHYLKPENFIDEWIQAIKDAGIKKIEGSIIGDASEFCMPYQPGTWLYEDIGNYYASPISGLSIYENIYKLDFATGFNNGDSTVILGMKPHIEGYSFNNQVVSADKGGDQAYIMGGTASSQKLVVGSLPFRKLSYTIRGSIDNPPLLAAQILNDELKKAG
ncbi:MAG: D-alanyl-D-alanine carboxypeptidase/D-alanyl-D-alanine-endopeptidase, partial [Bacteroidales bacterium]|nr:D-alanyl-D-alanine carboxypeptidase/D-alanyl-D-alanine-endopeptidase [Bacteroidales bacterium]